MSCYYGHILMLKCLEMNFLSPGWNCSKVFSKIVGKLSLSGAARPLKGIGASFFEGTGWFFPLFIALNHLNIQFARRK